MFDIGETIIHKRDICEVVDILEKYRDDGDYYKLRVLDDSGVTIYSPIENTFGLLRRPISKADALELIENIPDIEPVQLSKMNVGQEYKALVDSGKHADLVRVIKTSYLRREEKEAVRKKPGENDRIYFRLAEQVLYDELAVSLGMTFTQARDFVMSRVAALTA